MTTGEARGTGGRSEAWNCIIGVMDHIGIGKSRKFCRLGDRGRNTELYVPQNNVSAKIKEIESAVNV